MERLIKAGADPNYKNANKLNSLHMVTLKKDLKMSGLIIKNIKNINAQTVTGDTALHYACSYQLYDMVELLLKYGANPNIPEFEHEMYPIFYSVIQDDINIVKLLVKANFDPIRQDSNGNTMAHYAIISNNFDIHRLYFWFLSN